MNARRKCPHCLYPIKHGGNGWPRRECCHCKREIPATLRKLSTRPRPIVYTLETYTLARALDKLEQAGGGPHRYDVLDAAEAWAVKMFGRAIVSAVLSADRAGRRRPRVFRFSGGKVHLRYFEDGSIRICSSRTGHELAATYPGKGWWH